jgi:tetratricopeptide (TPR) repeat protein
MSNPYSIFDKAEKKRALSKFLEAIPLYLEAMRLSGVDKELKTACYFSLGDTYRMVGDFTKSGACYRAAHKLVLAAGDETRALDARVGLALSLRATGELKEALSIFNESLKAYKKLEDKAGVAFTLWSRAGALRLKGDLNPAIEGFKEAKTMFSRMRERGGVGYCLTGLGGASRVMGKHKDSNKYYTQANSLFRELKDTFGVAYSYCGIANSMRMMGDFKGSLKFFKKAKDNYKKIGDKVSYAYTLWGEGTALQVLGRDTEALKDFQEAAALFKETRDRRGLIYCALSVGELDFKKDRKKGVRAFSSALKKAEKLGLGVESRYARELLMAAQKSPESIPLNLA